MSVRSAILKAFKGQKFAAAADAEHKVIPFATRTRKRKRVMPKRYKRIAPFGDSGGNDFTGKAGKHQDFFKKETIKGKPYMRRDDGALFALQKDGSWRLVSEPRGAKGGGSLLPWAIGGGVAAAGGIAAYEAGKRTRR